MVDCGNQGGTTGVEMSGAKSFAFNCSRPFNV